MPGGRVLRVDAYSGCPPARPPLGRFAYRRSCRRRRQPRRGRASGRSGQARTLVPWVLRPGPATDRCTPEAPCRPGRLTAALHVATSPAPAITTPDRPDCGNRSGRQGARPGGTGLRPDQPADLPSLRLQALHGRGHGPLHPTQVALRSDLYGLLRDYFPKGTDLSPLTPEALEHVADEINNRPRKTSSSEGAPRLPAWQASTARPQTDLVPRVGGTRSERFSLDRTEHRPTPARPRSCRQTAPAPASFR
jgi:hypothetical protein